ncbi:MAG: chorismate pyruvate-lyase family protein, partial [Mycobacterium sp.]
DRPIGEVIAASCLETFKEAATVWKGELPGWLAHAGYRDSRPRTVARRYRIVTGGRPVIIITEYFLRNVFQAAPLDASPERAHSGGLGRSQ